MDILPSTLVYNVSIKIIPGYFSFKYFSYINHGKRIERFTRMSCNNFQKCKLFETEVISCEQVSSSADSYNQINKK
jgi:hypothetical protein